MKILSVVLLTFFSLNALATEELMKKCSPLAEKIVQKKAGRGYDRDGFWAYQCELAPNKAVVICELGASKGNGAAVDTFRAVLNKSCTKVLRVDLISEE